MGVVAHFAEGSRQRSGGQILVDQLRIHGVDMLFCVPGESYLAALDAMYEPSSGIEAVVTRHEGGAANMAEAYGKLTGRPGICFVTRGPGATNASIGVHTAMQDSTPMILVVGQVDSGHMGREAFQEIDYPRMFGGLAKWVAQIDMAERIPEIVHRAFVTATSGRPGPVVLAVPEDVLRSQAVTMDAEPFSAVQPVPSAEAVQSMGELLQRAQRPMILVGGSGWDAESVHELGAFAERWHIPVVTGFRREHLADGRSQSYVGTMSSHASQALKERVRQSDVFVVVGSRLGRVTTDGYSLLRVPSPEQKLVHVHSSPDEFGAVYQPYLAIPSSVRAFTRALASLSPATEPAWRDWYESAREEYMARFQDYRSPGAVDLARVMSALNETLPEDSIITCGAGNYTAWCQRFYRFSRYGTQLAPTSGAMGYGIPAAVAAKAIYPGREVVAMAGDGDFLMTGQELATAAQYGLKIIVIVVNNGSYGSIKMHQELQYPGRSIATDLDNPDFVGYARAFGGWGERAESTDEFAAALKRALDVETLALIELVVDPTVGTPDIGVGSID